MSTADLLFELGTEELPAGEIAGMAHALRKGITDGLAEQGLSFSDACDYSTTRRLAVLEHQHVPHAGFERPAGLQRRATALGVACADGEHAVNDDDLHGEARASQRAQLPRAAPASRRRRDASCS